MATAERRESGTDGVPGRFDFLRVANLVRAGRFAQHPVHALAGDYALDIVGSERLNRTRRLLATITIDDGVDVHMGRKLLGQFRTETRQNIDHTARYV